MPKPYADKRIVHPESIVSIADSASLSIEGSFEVNASWFDDERRRYKSESCTPVRRNSACIRANRISMVNGLVI